MSGCSFLAGTIEERIFQRQVSKQGLSGTVVDLGKGADHTSFSTSELRDLFSLTDTPSLTHDLLNCSCSMDGSVQGRHIDARTNGNIWLHCDLLTHCFLHSQLLWRRRSRFLIGRASLVAKVTAGGQHRNIWACPSWCSGDISLVTHTPSWTPTLITHETTSPSPSRPPSLTWLTKHAWDYTVDTDDSHRQTHIFLLRVCLQAFWALSTSWLQHMSETHRGSSSFEWLFVRFCFCLECFFIYSKTFSIKLY